VDVREKNLNVRVRSVVCGGERGNKERVRERRKKVIKSMKRKKSRIFICSKESVGG
jgi:hypothetical protein